MFLRRASRLAAPIFLLGAGLTHAAPVAYVARLSGAEEFPPNISSGTGYAEIDFDSTANSMLVAANFSGLSANVTAAHIHCCAGPGANAPVATTTPSFPGFPSGVTAGTYLMVFDTTAASTYNATFINNNGGSVASAEATLENGLAAGLAYFNIHSATFPGGEIRGQLLLLAIFADSFEGG
jgi:hypothetical protein